MAVEFRGIHALNFGHSALIDTCMLHSQLIFEHICPLGQVINVEMGRGVLGGLIVGETILLFVL